jgi:hypothetical protein
MKNIWKYRDLEHLLEKDFPLVRRWAFERIVGFYAESRLPRIAELIDDKDEYISSGAIRYISTHQHKRWAFRILRKFQDSTGMVAASCAVALGEMGCVDAIPFFQHRIEHDDIDFEAMIGMIRALELMPSDESTQLLILIADIYSGSSSGAFIARICDALLSTRHSEAVRLVAELYMEHAFSLDDRGESILRCISRRTKGLEFIDEFRSFIEGRPVDILRHIKESVRHKLGEILGESFVRKTAEKFLKTNYLQLLSDIRRTAEMGLYSKGIIQDGDELNDPLVSSQELLNYHCIDRFASETRLLHVMNLGEVKKVIILCICALLRIVYPARTEKCVDTGGTGDIKALIRSLENAANTGEVIARIVELADSPEKRESVRWGTSAAMNRNGKSRSIVRYLKLLKELEPDKSLDIFWKYLDVQTDDSVCETAEEGMIAAGAPAVEFIEKRFHTGDESQKMFALGIVSRIPLSKSVSLILRNFDEMWDGFRDFVLYAVNELGSRRFIGPALERLIESPMPDIEETYLLLCEINGIEDSRTDGVRARIIAELERADGGMDIGCDRLKALRRNHCNRKLICRQCDLSRRPA